MAKRGRPRKAGARNKSGRLVPAFDRGNDKVQARAELYRKCQGGKADGQLGDSVGRAWAAGLLDGTECDAAILRDAGRRYGRLYWAIFADMAPKMGAVERGDRGRSTGSSEDPQGEQFARLDRAAMRRGRDAYAAMQALCVNDWWFPDADAAWIARLLDASLRHREADLSDLAKLALAKQGLCSLVDAPARIVDAIPMHRLTAA